MDLEEGCFCHISFSYIDSQISILGKTLSDSSSQRLDTDMCLFTMAVKWWLLEESAYYFSSISLLPHSSSEKVCYLIINCSISGISEKVFNRKLYVSIKIGNLAI